MGAMALYNDESNGASHPWRAVSYGNEHSAAVRVPAGVKSLGGHSIGRRARDPPGSWRYQEGRGAGPLTFTIFIQGLAGSMTAIEGCSGDDTVLSVKERRQQKFMGVASELMDYIFEGECLENDRTLADYNIMNQSRIYEMNALSDEAKAKLKDQRREGNEAS